jgi:hypothetical protein
VPYWLTRSSIKWNKMDTMVNWWRYWTHLFIATNKTNYSMMSVRFLWVLWSLNPAVKRVYDENRVLSFSGNPGTGIAMDGVCMMV